MFNDSFIVIQLTNRLRYLLRVAWFCVLESRKRTKVRTAVIMGNAWSDSYTYFRVVMKYAELPGRV